MTDTTPAPGAITAAALEPLRLTLQGIADRMQTLLMQTAVSTVAREGGDCSAAIFLPDGRLLAQSRSLPLLLGSLIPAVQAVLARFPAAAMAAGDGFLLNDPWSGGSHLPDLVLLQPLLHGGRVRALAAVNLHHQDVGGITPGSVPPQATSIYHEGLRLPPLQSHRAGCLDAALQTILCANSRAPQLLLGDLAAQQAAGALAGRELAILCQRMGADFELGCEGLIAQAEALTRQALAAAPDGCYEWHDALDGDGVDEQAVPIRVALHKRGDTLRIDFTGSAAQTRGPANASRASMLSAALYFMRTLAPEAPGNAGCLAPLELVLPEGSVVNPRWPAAVNARTATVKLAANALLCAWSRGAGGLSMAAHAGVAVVLAVGGERGNGSAFFFTEIIASGAGGHQHGDGAGGISTDVGNARNTPIEVLESIAPLRVETYALRAGSGGAGQHRGGDGVRRVYRLLEGRAQVSYRSERHHHRAQGVLGGDAGARSQAQLLRADGSVETLAARAQFEWRAGDRLVIETAGGGGWGLPRCAPTDMTAQETEREAGTRVTHPHAATPRGTLES